MDNDWKLGIAKELRNSGYPVDMNKVIWKHFASS
jgi:hypothetical protein